MKKNRLFTKAIALVLAIMTVFSVMSAGFTASAMDMENASKKAAKALITTGAGKIPVIGDFAKSALDPILSELFGIKGDTAVILEKLDEISKKIDALEATLEKDTQDILKNLTTAQYSEFNSSITSLRTMVETNYRFLKSVEKSNKSDYAKMVLIAEMLDFDLKNAEQFEVLTQTLRNYVGGTQISFGNTQGVYEYVLMSKCDGAIIGGNAAIKASGYVNEVNEVISSAYKLMIIVLGEKIRFYQGMKDGSINEAMENDEELRDALETITSQKLACYKSATYRDYWAELLGEESNEGYIGDYNRMFDLENPDSTVSKYNAKVESIWFSYIRGIKYTADGASAEFVPLNREISYTTAAKCGLDDSVGKYQVESMVKKTTSNINAKITSVLTKAEVKALYELFLSNPVLSTDENGERLSLLDALRDYGFTCDAWENSEEGEVMRKAMEALAKVFEAMGIKTEVAEKYYINPSFALEANYKYINVDNSTQCYWDAKGNFKSYSGTGNKIVTEKTNSDGTVSYSFTSTTSEYYSFHQARGCDEKVESHPINEAIMYFTAA